MKTATAEDLVQVANLESGAAFGELSLLSNYKRSATVKAKTSLAVAVLYKEEYNRILRSQHDGQLKEKVKFLRAFPMLAEWTQQALSKLSYYFKELNLAKGEVLYKEGDEAVNVFFIKSGSFEVGRNVVRQENGPSARSALSSEALLQAREGQSRLSAAASHHQKRAGNPRLLRSALISRVRLHLHLLV